MEAQIRLATREDAEALARLRWNMYAEEAVPPESYESFASRFRAFAEGALSSDWMVWVAEAESKLVANAWLQLVRRVPRPVNKSPAPLAYLTNVYVEPPYRNAGLGSRILQEVIDWSREHPVAVVVVWPADRPVPYYRRAGFEPADSLQLTLTED